MINAFNGTEAQEQESIRNLVDSMLHREKGLFTRCKACTFPGSNETTWKREIELET